MISRATSIPACSARVRDAPVCRYADSGSELEKGFAPLQYSSYTLRALRPGYMYVFMKGTNGENLLGLEGLDSKWAKEKTWPHSKWTPNTHNEVLQQTARVEFTILLRGFRPGQSNWHAKLSSHHNKSGSAPLPINPKCYATSAGLILNFPNDTQGQRQATLKISHP
ncbi:MULTISPECIES: hypothetical protein [unclassified Pseudomonas]|uniref:hypothetical protein n=1 Tax=unclassified Pseudomonas TaxID=196821 RepID=UPI00382A78E8